jgi:phosphoribosylaminoimidazolecarboxamide formyltransferase / IMP cyclohydrolase
VIGADSRAKVTEPETEISMRAIFATYDKTGVLAFAQGLAELGWELAATSGTARLLTNAELMVTEVAGLTGSPEMLGGRVKTLHPKVFGGVLYRRGVIEDETDVTANGLSSIDLVVCNFYPFPGMVQAEREAVGLAIEQIDVGGPALLRAAAKNFRWVLPVFDAADYAPILEMLRGAGGSPGGVSLEIRRSLAAKVFRYTGHYDLLIAAYFDGRDVTMVQP